MENIKPQNGIQTNSNPSFKSLLLILMLIAPFIYGLILYLLGSITASSSTAITIGQQDLLDTLFLAFIMISMGEICFTYAFIIPWAWKEYQTDKAQSFFKFFLAIAYGESMVVFGLILTILSWVYSHEVLWNYYYLFSFAGILDMLVVYTLHVPKDFRTLRRMVIFEGIEPRIPVNPKFNKGGLILGIICMIAAFGYLFYRTNFISYFFGMW